MGKINQTDHKITIPKGQYIGQIFKYLHQMVIIFTKVYHEKAFKSTYTKIGIFGLKINHLATLM
jgi:hypothetical protein